MPRSPHPCGPLFKRWPEVSADGTTRPATVAVPQHLLGLAHDLRAAHAQVMAGLRLIDPSGLDPASLSQYLRVRAAAESTARLFRALSLGLDPARARDLQSAEPPLLVDLLEDQRRRGTAAAQAMGRSFVLVPPPNLPGTLAVDPTVMDRIATNLVDNALRHSKVGPVTLQVFLCEGDLRITVADDGPGPSPAVLAQLRTGDVTERRGLAIVQALVDDLGGTLGFVPRPGGGNVVEVRLPRSAAIQGTAPAMVQGDDGGGNGIHLLDGDRLCQLLDMAGEETARQLIVRLRADLRGVGAKLAEAVSRHDATGLRYQSHVLISLAATIGATDLVHLAEAVNTAAHDGRFDRAEDLRRNIARQIAALSVYLGQIDPAASGKV